MVCVYVEDGVVESKDICIMEEAWRCRQSRLVVHAAQPGQSPSPSPTDKSQVALSLQSLSLLGGPQAARAQSAPSCFRVSYFATAIRDPSTLRRSSTLSTLSTNTTSHIHSWSRDTFPRPIESRPATHAFPQWEFSHHTSLLASSTRPQTQQRA